MAWLGWFLRSESAHDHLHVHASPAQALLAGQRTLKPDGSANFTRNGQTFTTQAPRWLKLAPAPADLPPLPTGPHRHRSLAFDSLAGGQWCGLFAPAALPVLDLPALAGLVPPPVVAPLRSHWRLLPGRAPPVCA